MKPFLLPIVIAIALACIFACDLTGSGSDDTNADLMDLDVSAGSLSPAFSAGITNYTATVSSDTEAVTLAVTKMASGSTLEIQLNGSAWQNVLSGHPSEPLELLVGENTIQIRVTAADGATTKIYTVAVYRLSADALLADLGADTGTLEPVFNPEVIEYALNVPSTTTSITVSANPEHSGAKMQVNVNYTGWVDLQPGVSSSALATGEGDNPVLIRVTAEDGVETNTYTVTVHRTSGDATLVDLVPDTGTLDPAFDSATTAYTVSVGSTVNLLKVTPTSKSSSAAIHVRANGGVWQLCSSGVPSSSLWLDVGDNVVEVRVNAEDGTAQTIYTVAVRRMNGNADLLFLAVDPGFLNPIFQPAVVTYTNTVVNSQATMTLTPTVEDLLATLQIQVNGAGWFDQQSGVTTSPIDLDFGTNTIELRVTAEDPAVTKVYTLLAVRRHAGALDVEFAAGGQGINTYALDRQSDGKVVIGGNTYTGAFHGRIARLLNDGTVDAGFRNIGLNEWGGTALRAICVLSNGNILVGGGFDNYLGTAVGNIARLYSNGDLDTTFLSIGAGADYSVGTIAEQADGKILIGGGFSMYNGIARGRIARLNSDGSLDTAFLATGSGANGTVSAVEILSNGQILIGGTFTEYNGVARGRIARLNSDGSLDTSFLATGSGASGKLGMNLNSTIEAIAVQSDGKILIGGTFTTYNGVTRNGIARLNTDGSLDTVFLAAGSGVTYSVNSIIVLGDGKILIGGSFSTYNDVARSSTARINSDGSLDTSFLDIGTGAGGTVYGMAVQPDGRIILGGNFSRYNGVEPGHVVRIWHE